MAGGHRRRSDASVPAASERTYIPRGLPMTQQSVPTRWRRSALRRRLSLSVARMRHAVRWDYVTNPRSTRLLERQRPPLSPAQQRVVTESTRRGIAFTTTQELGVDETVFRSLGALVNGFAGSDEVRDRIARFPEEVKRRKMSGDDYMIKLYPEGPTLAWENPLLRLGLGAPVLNVVNGYLGMWSKLIYTDAWHTIPYDAGQRIGSQRWHRDPEDRKMIKAYLYFADADEGAGPMEYVPGSMMGGPLYKPWGWKPLQDPWRAIPRRGRVRSGPAGRGTGEMRGIQRHLHLLRHLRTASRRHRPLKRPHSGDLDLRDPRGLGAPRNAHDRLRRCGSRR